MSFRPSAARAALSTALVAAALAGGASVASAQSAGDGFLFRRPVGTLALRVGYDQALAGSDFYSDATDRLTLNRGSFGALAVGADLALSVRSRADVVFSGTFARSSRGSEYRDFIGTNDLPITQRTSLTRVPLTAALRYYLAPRGEQVGAFAWIPGGVAPFVSAGAGAVYYNLRQNGEVLNEATLIARPADLRSDGWAGALLGAAGVDVSLSPRLLLTTEARYTRASAALSDNFVGFEPLDLSGIALTAGVAVRF